MKALKIFLAICGVLFALDTINFLAERPHALAQEQLALQEELNRIQLQPDRKVLMVSNEGNPSQEDPRIDERYKFLFLPSFCDSTLLFVGSQFGFSSQHAGTSFTVTAIEADGVVLNCVRETFDIFGFRRDRSLGNIKLKWKNISNKPYSHEGCHTLAP